MMDTQERGTTKIEIEIPNKVADNNLALYIAAVENTKEQLRKYIPDGDNISFTYRFVDSDSRSGN